MIGHGVVDWLVAVFHSILTCSVVELFNKDSYINYRKWASVTSKNVNETTHLCERLLTRHEDC